MQCCVKIDTYVPVATCIQCVICVGIFSNVDTFLQALRSSVFGEWHLYKSGK